MKNRFIICLISILVAVLIVIGFNLFTKKDDTGLTTIKLAEVTHSVFYTPLYVAIEEGYFKEVDINLELVLTPGADKVSAAVLSGDVNVGFAGAESAIYIYEAGEHDYLQIFGGLTKRDGQFIVSREEIKDFTIEDLVGKEVIAGRSGGMPALNFENSIENAGIDSNDININTSIDFTSMTGAFISGTGDFVNLFEPNATLLEQEGYGYVVASVGELSGEVPYTTFYAKNSYIKNNEEILVKFNQAIKKGLDFVNENNETVTAEAIIKQFPDMSIDDLSLMIKRYKDSDSWLSTPYISEDIFNNLENFLIKFNLLDGKTNYDNIVNNLYE